MNNDARVNLWGTTIGAVTWLEDREIGVFQYAPDFLASGIQLSPLMMPLGEFPFEFPALARNTFKGLPGLLADSLPDKYGNAIIDDWLASQSRSASSFHPVERLCYVGRRGMGALEFEPATTGPREKASDVDIAKLVELAGRILSERESLGGVFTGTDDRETIEDILRVGTSAGGARAKAILAWNPETNEFRSGQIEATDGFEQWLMKFDGISESDAVGLSTPKGYGKIEYAYHLMAQKAGIEMMPCRLHHEGGRSHFMTKRFDRGTGGRKEHMQSLGAMAHFDYQQPDSYSYEQALQIMKTLRLNRSDLVELVRRAVFNGIACNRDDHVKNIAFLMNRRGEWRLSPAYDVTYAYNPVAGWTHRHQMSISSKRADFQREDFVKLASLADMKTKSANDLIDEVSEVISRWKEYAEEAGVSEETADSIQRMHLNLGI